MISDMKTYVVSFNFSQTDDYTVVVSASTAESAWKIVQRRFIGARVYSMIREVNQDIR